MTERWIRQLAFLVFQGRSKSPLCFSGAVSGNLNAAFELPFVFGVCDVLSHSQYYSLVLKAAICVCHLLISVSEQPEPPQMY